MKIDINELIEADDPDRTTKKAEFRKLYPEIHKKLGRWTARDMVTWLEKRGLVLSVELFRVYLRDLDREHGYSRSAKKAQVPRAPAPTCPGGTPGEPVETASTACPGEKHAETMQDSAEALVSPRPVGSRRPSILSTTKDKFGGLEPSPAGGMVDLNQTTKGAANGN